MKKILQKISRGWAKQHPEEMARLLDDIVAEERRELFQQLKPEELAPVIHHMKPMSVAEVLNDLPPERVSEILEAIPTKKAFLVFQQLTQEIRQQLDVHLSPGTRKQLLKLGSYPPNSIGLLVNPHVMTLKKEQIVREVIRTVHKRYKNAPDIIYYLYVTDDEHHLVGLVSIRDLLLSDPGQTIGNIMKPNVVDVLATRDQEEVVPIIKEHNFVAVPVVDEDNHFLGVVQHDDILPMMETEASEDIQKIFGAGEDERVFSTPWYSIKKRLPWLHVNLVTAFIAVLVVSFFESTIAQITTLAVLLPVVAGQSGNSGAQTLAVVIRGLALREVGRHMVWRVILKELFIGLVNGLVVGLIAGLVVFFWTHNLGLAGVLGLAMVSGMLIAGLAGAAIPIVLKALGQDPAQSSSIILTTVTDVVGFGGFLFLAHLFTKTILQT